MKSFVIPVEGTEYHIGVDYYKSHCENNKIHCHLNKGSEEIALIWLAGEKEYCFEEEPAEISVEDRERIISLVRENFVELGLAYCHNKIEGISAEEAQNTIPFRIISRGK